MPALSPWRHSGILKLDTVTIGFILQLQREFYEQWGIWPTPELILDQIRTPVEKL